MAEGENPNVDKSLGLSTLSRRSILSGGAAAVAATTIIPTTMARAQGVDPLMPVAGPKTAADYPVSDVMIQFSRYLAEAKNKELPAEVVEHSKWNVLDTIACMISGSQLLPGQRALQFAKAYAGKPIATIAADRTLGNPAEAALVNAILANADETDDYAPGPWHPGPNIIPAALAIGEESQISGTHFLRSVVLGYDVGTRVIAAAGVKMDFKRPTNSMAGVFGATATAACAASLTPQQMQWAMAYAAQQCAGIDTFQRDPDHIEKAFVTGGLGAKAGALTAMMLKQGFTGVNDTFSGPTSFFSPYEETAVPAKLLDRLGERYVILESKFKYNPTGGPTLPIVEAMRALLRRVSIDHRNVAEIILRSRPGFVTDNAAILGVNVQHIVGLMLVDKRLNFTNIHDEPRVHDPRIVRLRGLTKLVGGPSISAPDPKGTVYSPYVVQIVMKDGKRHVQEEVKDFPGSPSKPTTREWIVDKARTLMSPVLEGRTDALIDAVLNIDKMDNILKLRPLLQMDPISGPPRLSEWPEKNGKI